MASSSLVICISNASNSEVDMVAINAQQPGTNINL